MDYRLSDLVNKENIIGFCKNLFINTGINCSIIDLDGEIFLPYENFEIITSKTLGNLNIQAMTLANNHKVVSDLQNSKSFICNTCYSHLTLFAVPILKNSNYIATLYCAICDSSLLQTNLKHLDNINNLVNFLKSLSSIIGDLASNYTNALDYTKQLSLMYMTGFYSDAIQTTELVNKVHKMEYYDSLTDLPNRFSLCKTLDEMCKNNNPFAIAFLDLDNFKSINETLGHSCGDNLLKLLTQDFIDGLDTDSDVYRWDGDEFIFVFKNISSESTLCEQMNKLIHLLNNPIMVNEHELYITGSLGGCIYPLHGISTEELIKNSDIAMTQSKSLGKNTYQVYHSSFSIKALEGIQLERNLRHALRNNEFQIYYQPRVNICNNKLVGMEALIRWVKPDGTIISPGDFIYKAEESGLIVPIGEFVIKTVCKKIKEWRERGHELTVSLNLSPYQIDDKNLIKVIKNSILENQIPPSSIEFEITESAAINDMNQTIELLNELKNLGIKVLLDDFGTGYSSLNFLRLLPVSTIKIDKSFIDKVCEDSTEKTIVCYLISLAHSIKLKVIAEGIENPSQLYFLKDNLCDEAQGYYFSKPVSADEFEKLLA